MNYKFKTKPYAHQLKALERSWDKEYFAYFMEMGTGKSKVLIDNVAMLYDRGDINGLLLIAPKGVYKNWYKGEIPQHMPDHIEKKVVLWETSNSSPAQIKKLNTNLIISKKKLLGAFKHKGFWQCMDTKRDKIILEKSIKQKKYKI